MNKFIITTALLSVVAPAMAAKTMSMEEHTMQAVLQMQVAQEKRGATIVTVGDEVDCDFRLGTTRIQDAIDSGADEIRIANSTYNENLVIDDISVSLIGGYSNCANASSDISNNSAQTINANGAALPGLQISGNSQRNTVNLELLTFQNGTGTGFFAGGGVTTLTADLELNMDRVTLSLNDGILGGGLAVVGGDTDITLLNTLIVSNTADGGGGIYCSSNEASIFINDDGNGASGIFNNQATNGDGGGVLLSSGCTLSSFSGRPEDFGFLDTRGIVSNSATGNGGGIAVESGASASLFGSLFCFFGCLGDNTRPVNIDFNTADSDNDEVGFGGGVYVTGTDSVVNLTNTYIKDNNAQSGGGIAAENEATVNIQSLYVFGTCWSPGSCSQLNDNATATVGFPVRGGGLYATSGAVVSMSNTLVSGNRADFGTALYTLSEGADPTVTNLDVEGSLIVNNGDDGADGWSDFDTIRINGGEVKLDYNTIADNDVGGGTSINNSGTLDLFSSIIHNTDGTSVYSGAGTMGTAGSECLMVNETASLPAEPQTVVDDPEFVDRLNGDFHLNASISPALDFCSTAFASTPDFNDSDNDPRPFDDPLATNFEGPYDVGYDESYDNDIIFENGFE